MAPRRSVQLAILILMGLGVGYLLFYPGSKEMTPRQAPAVSAPTDKVIGSSEEEPEVVTPVIQKESHIHEQQLVNQPTPPKWPALKERMRRDHEGLEVVVHENGCKGVHLQGRFAHAAVAVRNEDGQYVMQCFSDYNALEAATTGKAAPPPADRKTKSHEVAAF